MGQKSNYENSVYNQLQDVMTRFDSFEKNTKVEIIRLNNKIDTLTVENTKLKIDNQLLTDDNLRLKSILNNDSNNSSLPPSSDQKHKSVNEYNSRTKTGKKSGGQKGHKGTTLTKKDVLEKIKTGDYEHQIIHLGKASKTHTYKQKFVLDLKVTPVIQEIRIYPDSKGRYTIPERFKSDVTYGSMVKALSVELYAEGVVSNERICNFINTISNNQLNVSSGSIYSFIKSFSNKCIPSIKRIEGQLLNSQTVSTDATNMTNNGSPCYIRNFSTQETVLYTSMDKKNLKSLRKIPFLMEFSGILEHDHETALYHFGTGHGECNVHLLRYLKKNSEETNNIWSDMMIKLLCEFNQSRKVRIKSDEYFSKIERRTYEERYDSLIDIGRKQNIACNTKYAKKKEKTLLNRLVKYKENHLLFLKDFSVPFENNMSERDLRKCKNRQKMSGGFRKSNGHEMYCKILSVIETCKRRNMNAFQNIITIFEESQSIF
jgi:hypothetical protein